MRFLVTGGSGFLGINLIRYLLKAGHEVTSIDLEKFSYPEKDRVRVILGDIRKREDVQKAMSDVDCVIHCAAALPLYSDEEIHGVNVEGTRILLEESAYKKFIYISSTAVYGVPNHHPIFEGDKLYGVGPYGETKIEAEKICEKFRSQKCVTILRPKSFVGPERLGVFALLFEWADDGHNFPLLGNGKNKYQLLDVEDLCRAIYLCCKEDYNDTFNVGAKEFKSMKEDFQAVLDAAGKGRRIICLPAKPVVLVLKVLEKLKLSPIYQWVYATASKDSYVSIEKIEKVVGFTPKYSNQEALIRSFTWYQKHRKEYEGRSGVSHRVPWKQGILKVVKFFF